MMILVGQLDSPFVRRVAATMSHYDIAFDRHVLSVFGDRDEVMRLNPLGKVPALIIDEGETLVDSAVIIDYLDEIAPPERRLTPSAGPGRRNVLRLATVAMGISERAVQLRVETVRRPAHLQSEEFIDNYRRSIRDSLDYLERETETPWSTGETLSQADFSATAALTHLSAKVEEFADLRAWPKLAAIRETGEALGAFKSNPFMEG
ncbi:MAG: glutathione S-transferase family protein [Rhodospirillales bacterium]|nr:glutathione S-transferase family protein [Rhodospirillales bacterium]MBO6786281.1 glutathione S-transferase family protein [Rhodospirillales bacterium]